MRLRIAIGLIAALAISTTAATAPCGEDGQGPAAPRGLAGKPWPLARARLAKLGYRPVAIVHSQNQIVCERSPDRCRLWPEIMDCSGTGMGYCAFLYRMPDGRLIQAVTSGDDGYERFEGLGWLPPGALKGVRLVDDASGKRR